MAKQVCVSAIVLGAFLAGSPPTQAQTDQQESVADAARRSREQKKEAPKPAKVITNDTLEPLKPETPAAPAVASTPAATDAPLSSATTDTRAAAAPAAASSTSTPAASETPDGAVAKQKALEALKRHIAEVQKDVDLAQRELNLANDDFYSKPDFSKDDAGKAKLEAMKNDLAQKADELTQLKAQLPAGTDGKEGKPAQSESQTQTQPQPNPPAQQ